MADRNERPHLHIGHRQRIKERYLEKGFAALDDKDVLELLLTFAIPRRDVYNTARELVDEFGSVINVLDSDSEALRERGGLTDHTIVLLKLVNDIRLQPDRCIEYRRERLKNVLTTVEYCHEVLEPFREETIVELFLDDNDYVKEVVKVSCGSNDAAVLPIETVVELAIRRRVHRIVVAHNHPSGSSVPSAADLMATEALKTKLASHGVELAEHVIVAKDECTALMHHQTISMPGGTFIPWKQPDM
ncbi:MAG: RadC family protein [Clostridia bacterium]|nr:RadC family protein [Clostridia bacterium]